VCGCVGVGVCVCVCVCVYQADDVPPPSTPWGPPYTAPRSAPPAGGGGGGGGYLGSSRGAAWEEGRAYTGREREAAVLYR
jgi:hypothetical protein